MRKRVIALVGLLAMGLVLVEAVAHDHASGSVAERSLRHGCIVCTGALDTAPAQPAPEPSTASFGDVQTAPASPVVACLLNPFHSGNAPPASSSLA